MLEKLFLDGQMANSYPPPPQAELLVLNTKIFKLLSPLEDGGREKRSGVGEGGGGDWEKERGRISLDG